MNNTRRKWLVRFGAALAVFALALAAVILSGTLSASADERQSVSVLQATPVVGFKFQSYSVPEGGTASISVVINQSPVTTATVEFLTVDGTAVANQDYVPANGVLTFSPSSGTEQSFFVQTIEDSVHEGDQTEARTWSRLGASVPLTIPELRPPSGPTVSG